MIVSCEQCLMDYILGRPERAHFDPAQGSPKRFRCSSRRRIRVAHCRLGSLALKAVCKGGRVVCGGIHMSDIPSFPYRLLWEERQIVSVANLTREDAVGFFAVAPRAGVQTRTSRYPLAAANEALADLREGRLQGAAVLVP
jgi:D-arabinose 1-dehydrogenase-like Zn-dependent alcohol dehydrogenase